MSISVLHIASHDRQSAINLSSRRRRRGLLEHMRHTQGLLPTGVHPETRESDAPRLHFPQLTVFDNLRQPHTRITSSIRNPDDELASAIRRQDVESLGVPRHVLVCDVPKPDEYVCHLVSPSPPLRPRQSRGIACLLHPSRDVLDTATVTPGLDSPHRAINQNHPATACAARTSRTIKFSHNCTTRSAVKTPVGRSASRGGS